MIHFICAVKDRAIDAFHTFHTVRAEGAAIRSFQDVLNDPQQGHLYKHPDDFDLYVVGTYDDSTGFITPETPRKIADGKQLQIERA